MTQNSITVTPNGGASFVGEKGVNAFVLTTLISGLTMYMKHGMLPNRAWTPKRMMEAAMRETGKKFKARDYSGAIEALKAHRDGVVAEVKKEMADA